MFVTADYISIIMVEIITIYGIYDSVTTGTTTTRLILREKINEEHRMRFIYIRFRFPEK